MSERVRRQPAVSCGVAIALAAAGFAMIVDTRGVEMGEVYGFRGGSGLIVVPFAIVGALVTTRRRSNPVGWLFLVTGVLLGFSVFGEGYAAESFVRGGLPLADAVAWAQNWMWVLFFGLGVIYPLLLFPDGSLPSPRWRWLAWMAPIPLAGFVVTVALEGGQLQSLPVGYENPYAVLEKGALDGMLMILGPMMIVAVVGAIVATGVRFRRSRGDLHEQMKWLVYAGSFSALGVVANIVASSAGIDSESLTLKVIAIFTISSIGGIAIAAGFAILKYRLYEIDVVISRTLTFGAMAVAITLVYVAIVAGIGSALGRGDEPNLGLSILGTAIVAVVFEPLRRRTHAFADRLVFGRRATVNEVLSELGASVAGALTVDEVLPRLARVVVDATTADRAAIWLVVGPSLQRAAAAPHAGPPLVTPLEGDEITMLPDADRVYPVRHAGELLGAISIGMRGTESVSDADDRLVSDVAGHAALILRNARLIAELQASRQRLVAAQDTERRRIERDIHDGAQQQLVALAMKLRLARGMIDDDPAGTLLDEIRADTTDALENLRALARGIYPPLLAERGLAPALESQAARAALPVTVEADGVGRYAQEVETTAYFCTLEALQNVAKYAGATLARVELAERDGGLAFSVTDDGAGFDPRTVTPGAGLSNMRDRIEALGGRLEITSRPGAGATIAGWVPATPR